ncbi:MAG: pyrroline-5-carboxylate reductase [Thaumarchaeota archaeon]|nr:MAG: pyrroline-5-carboxylate reductase [Nitrososphaerota archaeon]
MLKIGVIGAGQIGSAIARVLAQTGKYQVMASRRNIAEIKDLEKIGVKLTRDNRAVAEFADVVFLSVKPYKVSEVLREVGDLLGNKILISVAAAIPISKLSSLVPEAKIVRVMPNVGLIAKASFTAYTVGPNIADKDLEIVRGLLGDLGSYMEVDEDLMDAITALSGSGPAYVALLIEAMAYAGLKVGLPRDLAYQSATYTVYGTAKLILESKLHPSTVKEMVLTPGGTTIEGIFYLEEGGVRTAVMKAVEAATKRAKEIAQKLNNPK